MVFGIIYEDDNNKQHRLIFTSNISSYHFKIGRTLSKEELTETLEHVDADCKMFRGNSCSHHCKDSITPVKKKGPRFILSRHLEKKKIQKEVKEYKIDLEEISKKNEQTIKEMLESGIKSFRIIQSLSLPTSDSVDVFYGIKVSEEKEEDKDDKKNTKGGHEELMHEKDVVKDKTTSDMKSVIKKVYEKLKTVNQGNRRS